MIDVGLALNAQRKIVRILADNISNSDCGVNACAGFFVFEGDPVPDFGLCETT